jgi:hypothetical protein
MNVCPLLAGRSRVSAPTKHENEVTVQGEAELDELATERAPWVDLESNLNAELDRASWRRLFAWL